MNWLILVLLVILSSGLYEFMVKLLGGKINTVLAVVIALSIQLPFLLSYLAFIYFTSAKIATTKEGLIFSSLAGIFLVLANLSFFGMYAIGAPLNLASPIARVGTFLLATLLGVLLLKEGINLKIIIGYILAILGLILIATGK